MAGGASKATRSAKAAIGDAVPFSLETTGRRKGGLVALRSPCHRGQRYGWARARERLVTEVLWNGPEGFGFGGDVWNCSDIVRVIGNEFGLR